MFLAIVTTNRRKGNEANHWRNLLKTFFRQRCRKAGLDLQRCTKQMIVANGLKHEFSRVKRACYPQFPWKPCVAHTFARMRDVKTWQKVQIWNRWVTNLRCSYKTHSECIWDHAMKKNKEGAEWATEASRKKCPKGWWWKLLPIDSETKWILGIKPHIPNKHNMGWKMMTILPEFVKGERSQMGQLRCMKIMNLKESDKAAGHLLCSLTAGSNCLRSQNDMKAFWAALTACCSVRPNGGPGEQHCFRFRLADGQNGGATHYRPRSSQTGN